MGHSDMWSYSRVSSYNQCPYQWYLEYVEHRDEKDSNWYAENGSNMHETLELIANGVLSIYDAGGYYLDLADCNFEPIRQSTKENTENQCVDFFSSYDFNYLKDYDVVATEEEVFFNIGEYKFHGFIDLHLKDKDGNHIVVDYKSAFNTLKRMERQRNRILIHGMAILNRHTYIRKVFTRNMDVILLNWRGCFLGIRI